MNPAELFACFQTIEEIRTDIGNSPIWLQVDETKDPVGRCIVNVIVGALHSDHPSNAHLLLSREIPGESQNSDTFARLILDSFSKLSNSNCFNVEFHDFSGNFSSYLYRFALARGITDRSGIQVLFVFD